MKLAINQYQILQEKALNQKYEIKTYLSKEDEDEDEDVRIF